jgi:hypothetical protein
MFFLHKDRVKTFKFKYQQEIQSGFKPTIQKNLFVKIK